MFIIKHRKFLDSKVFSILLITLIWFTADNLLEFVFPTYLEGINKSYLEIGFLLSLASIAGILIDLPAGILSDRLSRKKMMISGLIISIITSILIFSFKANFSLVALFLFWGLAYQIWKVPRDAYFASLTEKEHRAKAYGLDSEVKYLSQTLGPLIGGWLVLWFGFKGILSFYVLFLVLSILILLIFIKETNHRPISQGVSSATRFSTYIAELKEFKNFGLRGIILLYFSLLLTAWEQVLWTFEPLFYGPNVLNIPSNLGGLLLACFSLPGIFLSYHSGKLADKLGKKQILLIGLLIMGTFLMLFSGTSNLYTVFFFALLTSIGWVFSLVSLNALIIDLSYKHKKGEIAGIWNFSMDIGFVLGPILGGFIAEEFGIKNMFFVVGILLLLSSLLTLFFKKDNTNQKP